MPQPKKTNPRIQFFDSWLISCESNLAKFSLCSKRIKHYTWIIHSFIHSINILWAPAICPPLFQTLQTQIPSFMEFYLRRQKWLHLNDYKHQSNILIVSYIISHVYVKYIRLCFVTCSITYVIYYFILWHLKQECQDAPVSKAS